jgi:membrane-bound metal-dependent hydrolase YbcI (DUF457 family)
MDIVSHAIAGAAVGAAFGQPLLGAAFGVLPDAVLGLQRRLTPPAAYNATHSLAFAVGPGAAAWAVLGTPVPLLALCSHLLLDVPTHGSRWAPTLFYPISERRFSLGSEWEWFNRSWRRGLALTLAWSAAWLFVAFG